MKFDKMVLGAAAVAASAIMVSAAPAQATLTVGNADAGNCYPFSCGPTDGLSEYQQAYRAGAFSGITTFNTISFTEFTAYVPGPSMDSGTYTVRFYVAANGVGSLSSVLASNEGTFLGTLGTFNVSGPMPSRLILSGSAITYDPSMGDLLMDVSVSGSSYSGVYNQFFNADYTGTDVARAWNSTSYGDFGNTTGALQTTFGVPEPAAWALMLIGVGAVGAGLRRRREAPAAA